MSVWYNENCPRTVCWLEALRDHGAITYGAIDPRSIEEVRSRDLDGVLRAHFFAGIGGWDYALQLADWPRAWPVWTASLPCQPFSVAGCAKGVCDERHLWPVFRDLVEQCRPSILFGEQVASPLGRAWLAAVQADLEALGYATAAADLCAAGVGAPHIRQRLYWMAYSRNAGLGVFGQQFAREECSTPERSSADYRMGDTGGSGGWRIGRTISGEETVGRGERGHPWHQFDESFLASLRGWADVVFVPCGDGKSRPIEPGLQPLVNGVSNRVGRLRGYGNAIVPQVAAAFVCSVIDVILFMLGAKNHECFVSR